MDAGTYSNRSLDDLDIGFFNEDFFEFFTDHSKLFNRKWLCFISEAVNKLIKVHFFVFFMFVLLRIEKRNNSIIVINNLLLKLWDKTLFYSEGR